MPPSSRTARAAAVSLSAALVLASATASVADGGYRRPPPAVAAVLEAPAFPDAFVSPAKDTVVLATPLRFPPASAAARFSVDAGGLRVDPVTNAADGAPAYVALRIVRIADGGTIDVPLPRDVRAGVPAFSPDGTHLAFAVSDGTGTHPIVADTATGALSSYADLRLNALAGDALAWLPDGRGLLLHLVDADRPPAPPDADDAPIVRETRGGVSRPSPRADAAAAPGSGARFAYFARGTYALLDLATNRAAGIVAPGVYADAKASPDGRFVAFRRYDGPFSDAAPWTSAAHRTTVVDRGGRTVAELQAVARDDDADPAAPAAGPRDVTWETSAPATLVWIGAGAAGRDVVFARDVPSQTAPRAVLAGTGRLDAIAFLDGTSLALAREYERGTRTSRTVEFDLDAARDGARGPETFGAVRDGDAFDDPGVPLARASANGDPVIERDGAAIFMSGEGYTTDGLRPFVDRLDPAAHAKTRLFQSSVDPIETVVAMLDAHGDAFLVRRQSPSQPPDLFVRHVARRELRQLTHFADPAPALRTLRPRVISYRRADGVGCSFTLYLPPGARPGTPLPTLLWAYPYEFEDRAAAGQNANFTQTFDDPHGAVARLAALAGYAVLDDASMPIVGDPKTGSATLVAQLTSDARAAIDAAAALGVTDRDRVAVGGHSYGAFMAATLLAHTHLFRAGIARSGAYNRSLTPFGFQNEPRTLWQAPDVYAKLSPFAYADRIAAPLLLIHGRRDDNPATPPLQSERMYDAIRGNGGTARLVLLPDDGHHYASLEGVETTEAETIDWLDRYLGGAAR